MPIALTVIIPVFNEERTIEDLLERVLQVPCDKQVLVVDDGSMDGTLALLEHLESRMPLAVLRHVDNFGKGAAIRTALPFAQGRLTIIQDGDLELSPTDYPRLLAPLLNGEADCVIGSRYLDSSERTSTFPASFSRLGVAVLNRCVRLWYGIRLTDEACCYKVLPTEILRRMDLQCERFEFCPEVVAKAARMKLRIKEVPVSYAPRSVSDGKKLRYRDGVEAIRTLRRWRKWLPPGGARLEGMSRSREDLDQDDRTSDLTGDPIRTMGTAVR